MSSSPFTIYQSSTPQRGVISRLGRNLVSCFTRFLNLNIVSGNYQSASIYTQLPLPLVVKVIDKNNQPVSGQRINWSTVNFGVFETTHSFTGTQGTSSILYTVDNLSGTGSVLATVNNNSVVFTTYKLTATPDIILAVSSQDQTTLANTPVSSIPSVKIIDIADNPVANYPVTFSIGTGGGSVTGSNQLTNSSGIATVGGWTSGPSGICSLICSASTNISGSPLTFTTTVIASSPTQISASAGNNQTGFIAGQVAPQKLEVLIRDSGNSAVANQLVYFGIYSDIPSTNSTSSVMIPSTSFTGPTGRASSSLSSSTIVGTIYPIAYFLDTTGSAIYTIFTESSTYGTKNKLKIYTEPASTGTSGLPLPGQPAIEIVDINNNRVSNATDAITASIASGNAVIVSGSATQSFAGLGTYRNLTLVDLDSGSNIIAFSSPGLTPISSALVSLIPPIPYKLQFSTSITDTTVGSTISSFYVNVLDNTDVLVPTANNTVTIQLSGSGATLSGTTTKVASNGSVLFSNLSLSNSGSFKFYATSSGLLPATSSLFNITSSSGSLHPNEPAGFSRIAEVDFTTQTTLPSNTTYQLYGAAGYWYSNRGHAAPNPSSVGGWRVQFPAGTTEGSTPNTLHVKASAAASPPTFSEVYIHIKGYRVGATVAEGGDGQFEQNGHGEKLVFIRMGNLSTGAVIMKNRGPGAPSRVVSQYGFRGGWDGGGTPPTVDYNGSLNLMQTGVECELEYYLKVNTPDVADGILKQWLNGAIINSLNITNGLWLVTGKSMNVYELWFDPTYGGGGGGVTKTRNDYIYIKSIYWSGKP